ncbi:hypothetical protein [Yoonia sp. 2307UL14-13]|uniref:hypothetical protein n=1 Tax=Yoonia sp. 2307UL14-13 TaxID=3126506 RepID=UPI0030AE3FE6
MKHLVFAAFASLTIAAAAPASAFGVAISFPNLTYPPQPGPETTQSCTAPATLKGDACVIPAK